MAHSAEGAISLLSALCSLLSALCSLLSAFPTPVPPDRLISRSLSFQPRHGSVMDLPYTFSVTFCAPSSMKLSIMNPCHHLAYELGMLARPHDLLGDPRLFLVLLVRVRMVRVDDDHGIGELALLVRLGYLDQVLIVIVGEALSELVHRAPQDAVRQRVARGLHLPTVVAEDVRSLRRLHGVKHDVEIAGRRVLHAHGDVQSAAGQAVLLVLDRTRTHGHVAQNVLEVGIVVGIEHLVRGRKVRLLQRPEVHFPDGLDALRRCSAPPWDSAGAPCPCTRCRWYAVCWYRCAGMRMILSFTSSWTSARREM